MAFPFFVMRNRFFAPLFDFTFGIVLPLLRLLFRFASARFGGNDHRYISSFLRHVLLYLDEAFYLRFYLVHYLEAEFGVNHLPAPEHQGEFHLVPAV